MLAYAVVSGQTEKAVDVFVRRENAEAFLGEVRADEPELANVLRAEEIEFGPPQ